MDAYAQQQEERAKKLLLKLDIGHLPDRSSLLQLLNWAMLDMPPHPRLQQPDFYQETNWGVLATNDPEKMLKEVLRVMKWEEKQVPNQFQSQDDVHHWAAELALLVLNDLGWAYPPTTSE